MRSRAAALLATVVLVAGCGKTQTAPPVQPAQPAGPRVIFPDGFAVHVEIASDDATRAEGLMYRDRLRPASGMLFLFPADGDYPFWMKNTLIPLDMIWIDSGRRIVHITSDVPPCKVEDCPSYPPGAVSRYVLEVAAGVAKEHRLQTGDALQFEGVENIPVR